jgi:serine/threonine-protein kinase
MEQVGGYRIDALLAEGGFADVYRATRLSDGLPVALKVMRGDEPAIAQMFDREAIALGLCDHPGLVQLLDAGRLASGARYLVLALVDGQDLGSLLHARGQLSVDEAVGLIADLGPAVAALHARGIIHRDVKAQNIMVRMVEGRLVPTLIDLGLATPAGDEPEDEGFAYGTPNSMSPEQILGGRIDARSDVYALGILLFQLLTGALPFKGPTVHELQDQHLRGPRPRLASHGAGNAALDKVIHRALEPEAERRYPDVERFVAALRRAAR